MNYIDPQTSKNIEQEQLIGYWAKSIGLTKKAIDKLDIETLHALRLSTKLLLGKRKYRDQLTPQFKAFLTNFQTQASKHKTNHKDNMAVFRLNKYIIRAHSKAKKQRTVNS